MFLSAEQHGLEWVFTYEPESQDFEEGLCGDPPRPTEAQLHRSLTRGMRSSDPDVEVERPPASNNNDRARARMYLEPGIYEITVHRDEIDDYIGAVNGITGPVFAHVMVRTNSGMLAQDVAFAKMIWLVRHLDPDHWVEEYPPGVRLAKSEFEARQEMLSSLRDDVAGTRGAMWEAALGPDWERKHADLLFEGHPIRPNRRFPEPEVREFGDFIGLH